MLFGSTLLEVAIGVIFVYLLLSLLCSAFSELIESFVKYRARDLHKGIGKLLGDKDLVDEFFKHPLVTPLGETPSYIPARTFSLTLWNLATTAAAKTEGAGVTQDLAKIRSLITSLEGPHYERIKVPLLALIDEAGTDINKARANIEQWYNDAMDRVSGWYKRRTHLMLVLIGLTAAAFLNVDTINVTRALWYNDTLRSSVLAAAENYIETNPRPEATPEASSTPAPSLSPTPQQEEEDNAEEEVEAAREKINGIRGEINKLGLPIGWVFEPDRKDEKYKDDKDGTLYKQDLEAYRADPRRFPDGQNGNGWPLKVVGIFLTALAVSQGAPFWFDLLNKVIVVRSTIKPHEKSPEQPSKDKPKKSGTDGDQEEE